jgi:hypothetical protein
MSVLQVSFAYEVIPCLRSALRALLRGRALAARATLEYGK